MWGRAGLGSLKEDGFTVFSRKKSGRDRHCLSGLGLSGICPGEDEASLSENKFGELNSEVEAEKTRLCSSGLSLVMSEKLLMGRPLMK